MHGVELAAGISTTANVSISGLADLANVTISGVTTFAGAIAANGNFDVDGLQNSMT